MHRDHASSHPIDPDLNLHVCPACASDLVQPVDWDPAGDSGWQILLRCPECEWSDTGVFSEAACARFDAELDHGIGVLTAALDALAAANVEDEIASFAAALDAGLILPEDFQVR